MPEINTARSERTFTARPSVANPARTSVGAVHVDVVPRVKPTQLGNLLGALVGLWLILAILTVASAGVYLLVDLLLQAK